MTGARPAVFLDRDGTLIADRHYLADPEGVELLPGAAEALRRINAAGYAAVLVTNQSGIGRGLFTEEEYRRVHERLVERLASAGGRLDGHYHCPLAPDDPDPDALRKPGAGLFRRAARELGLDPTRSWFVGDRLRDVLPARELGGRAVLVRSGQTEPVPDDWPSLPVVASLADAVDRMLEEAPDE